MIHLFILVPAAKPHKQRLSPTWQRQSGYSLEVQLALHTSLPGGGINVAYFAIPF
jgi:hypothetical protein